MFSQLAIPLIPLSFKLHWYEMASGFFLSITDFLNDDVSRKLPQLVLFFQILLPFEQNFTWAHETIADTISGNRIWKLRILSVWKEELLLQTISPPLTMKYAHTRRSKMRRQELKELKELKDLKDLKIWKILKWNLQVRVRPMTIWSRGNAWKKPISIRQNCGRIGAITLNRIQLESSLPVH